MAIQWSAGTAKATTGAPGRTGNGDLTITLPSTAGWPHFALIILYHDQGTGTVPTNWTQVTGSPFGAGTEKLQIFWKFLVPGEPNPVSTISGSGTNISHCANVALYHGVDLGTPIDAVGAASNGTGTPMTHATYNTATNNAVALSCSGRGDNENASGQTMGGSATGVTERLDGGTDQGNDSQVSMADKLIATAGAAGAGSSTTSVTDPWVSVGLALRPDVTAVPSIAAPEWMTLAPRVPPERERL